MYNIRYSLATLIIAYLDYLEIPKLDLAGGGLGIVKRTAMYTRWHPLLLLQHQSRLFLVRCMAYA